jgi:hypothetical protein
MNEKLQQDVAYVLEEAIKYTSTKLINYNLEKNGRITLEETQFLKKMAYDVITEAAEDFIPDTIEVPEVPEVPEGAVNQDTILTDEMGNAFTYNATTGELVPVDTPAEEQQLTEPVTAENGEEVLPEGILPNLDQTGDTVINESELIVARLLKF